MTSGWIFLISFVAISAGIAIGMALRNHVPADRLGPATKELIRLGAGFLATLAAVLLSLMIASAKSSYDTQDSHFRQLAAYLVETDQLLAQYGPETTEVRILMRQAVPAAIDRIWREFSFPSPTNVTHSPTAFRTKGDDYNRNPVGTGPYILKSWTAADRIVLEKNPDYWNKGHPYLDRIILKAPSRRAVAFCQPAVWRGRYHLGRPR